MAKWYASQYTNPNKLHENIQTYSFALSNSHMWGAEIQWKRALGKKPQLETPDTELGLH